ncbi:hypothetical protein [Amantichitinum ursilacus]|uniref:Lipoprotein n=1 Tax=Amantichitinum ursilacus TaxID=857265 RepID=A0A0N0XMG7_9NEIS|nr:hypothetical protein [Amantichitinum ursilacus]KPC54148.1 hypothetical protein WG78_05845 [Amantichitinum ursilacus]
MENTHKLTIALLMLLSAISGCTTMANAVPTIPDLINSNKFEGGDMKAVYAKFGKPQQVDKTADGQFVATWFYRSQYTLTDTANVVGAGPGGGVTITPTSNTRYYDKQCTVLVTYNSQNIVTHYKTVKNSPGSCNKFGV